MMSKLSSEWLLGISISFIAYYALFYANDWLTSYLSYGLGVNWIYLPAGLRLFLILIFGLPGALGIALSSFLISYYGDFATNITTCIGIGLISGFAPYIARLFVLRQISIAPDLSDLNLPKLLSCILIYAVLSAGLHQWWFLVRGLDETGSFNHFIVMFLGDVLGSLLLIALVKYSLDLLRVYRA